MLHHIFLHDWLEAFPSDQVLVLQVEEILENKKDWLEVIFEFLQTGMLIRATGVDHSRKELLISNASDAELNVKQWEEMLENYSEEENFKKNSVPPMMPETKKIIETFYEQFRENLNNLLESV